MAVLKPYEIDPPLHSITLPKWNVFNIRRRKTGKRAGMIIRNFNRADVKNYKYKLKNRDNVYERQFVGFVAEGPLFREICRGSDIDDVAETVYYWWLFS